MPEYYQLHYHMKESGVKYVIQNIFSCLPKEYTPHMLYAGEKGSFSFKNVDCIDIPLIDYSTKKHNSFEEISFDAHLIAKALEKKMLLDSECILHCHNVNLMKNVCLGYAIQVLADTHPSLRIIMQVHDFVEDGRQELLSMVTNLTGTVDLQLASKLMYPIAKNISYCTINSRDAQALEKGGISHVSVFPNCLDIEFLSSTPKSQGLLLEIAKYAKTNDYIFDVNRKILLAPIKILKRKNVGESLLLLTQLNAVKNEWQLLITLDAHSPSDVTYANTLKHFIREHDLPVTIGFGYTLISPTSQRTEKYKYTFRDILDVADVVVMTSIQEGFGMGYLEAWVSNTPVVGRRIPFIFKDFENEGITFDAFYDSIPVNGKDFSAYPIDEQLRIIEENSAPQISIISKILKNDFDVEGMRAVISQKYSLKSYYDRLSAMLKGPTTSDVSKKIDVQAIVDFFAGGNV